jgi:HK97 family phage portal protein
MGFRDFFRRSAKNNPPAGEQKSVPTPSLIPRQSQHPEWRDWSTQHAFREGYRASTWVYDAIEIRRRAVASVPWHVEVRNGDDWERAPDHPLAQLLSSPNPDFSQRQMIGRLVQWLDLGGNVYWLKVRGGRRRAPVEMWPVMPDAMRVIPGGSSSGRMVAGYRYEWDNVRTDFPAEDVTHFTYPNPGDFYYGMSPLRAAGMAVDIDTEAERFQKVSLQNRGIPDGVFTLGGEAVGREEWEQARQQVREQYQTKDSFRAPWVVAHAKWEQMSLSPADLDYIESRGFTRVEILSAFSVPPPLVGIYDDATLANIESARRIFWLEGIVPLLEEIRDQMTQALVPEFGSVNDLRIVYDTSNVEALREKFDEKVKSAQALWAMGVPFNEINQRLELGFDEDSVPGGEMGFVSAGLLPTDMATASGESMEPEPAAQGGDEEGVEAEGGALNSAQVEAIMALIDQVARGDLPRSSAIAIIVGGFPIEEEDAEEMVGEVGRTFFIDATGEDEERAAVPAEVKRRVQGRQRTSVKDMVRLAYGDEA